MDRLQLQNVEITRIVPGSEGRFIFASYPEWRYEYNFYVDSEGRIKGKTSADTWVDLSDETTHIIRQKLKDAFLEES